MLMLSLSSRCCCCFSITPWFNYPGLRYQLAKTPTWQCFQWRITNTAKTGTENHKCRLSGLSNSLRRNGTSLSHVFTLMLEHLHYLMKITKFRSPLTAHRQEFSSFCNPQVFHSILKMCSTMFCIHGALQFFVKPVLNTGALCLSDDVSSAMCFHQNAHFH